MEDALSRLSLQHYLASKHSFFNELATMIFSLFTHMYTKTTFHVLNRDGMPGQQRDAKDVLQDIRWPLQYSGFYIALDSNAANDSFMIPTLWLQTSINVGSWPNFIEYYRIPKLDIIPGQSFGFKSQNTFYRQVVAAAFINYFESQLPQIKNKYGTKREQWKGVVNFARIIRNGFAHDGKIKIDDPKFLPETWRNWTYGNANTGDEFFMTTTGLAIGDIILLFEDIHNDLYP